MVTFGIMTIVLAVVAEALVLSKKIDLGEMQFKANLTINNLKEERITIMAYLGVMTMSVVIFAIVTYMGISVGMKAQGRK